MARPRKTTDTDTPVLNSTEQPVRETATEINNGRKQKIMKVFLYFTICHNGNVIIFKFKKNILI